MPYYTDGQLKTDKREIAISETWDTQTDWTAYQSKTRIDISSGVVKLGQIAYPSSTKALYAADELSGYSDGGTVTSWPDSVGTFDLTAAGDPTYNANALNGLPTVAFDGTGDAFDNSSFSQSQPCAASAVVKTNAGTDQYVSDGNGTSRQICAIVDNSGTQTGPGSYAGVWLEGASAVSGYVVLTWIFDGASSSVRVNGSSVLSGDAGSQGVSSLALGSTYDMSGSFLNGEIAEYLRYDDTAEVTDAESYLNGKWGVY